MFFSLVEWSRMASPVSLSPLVSDRCGISPINLPSTDGQINQHVNTTIVTQGNSGLGA
jgi:hypothetical protein